MSIHSTETVSRRFCLIYRIRRPNGATHGYDVNVSEFFIACILNYPLISSQLQPN